MTEVRRYTLAEWKARWQGLNQMAYVLAYNVLVLGKHPVYTCTVGKEKVEVRA